MSRPLKLAWLSVVAVVVHGSCAVITGLDDFSVSPGTTAGSGGSAGGGACTPGSEEPCYTGSPGTADVGACRSGVQACTADGLGFSPCVGEVLPAPEVCENGGSDEDCDGRLCPGDVLWAVAAGGIRLATHGPRSVRAAFGCPGRPSRDAWSLACPKQPKMG